MWLPWTTPTLHERDIGLTIYPKENWNATNSCPSSGDWTLKEENNATYSLVPMDYYVADGEGCKATYAFEGSQAVVMGRTNPDYGVYGCMLDGDTTWHSAASEENNYQVQLCNWRSLSSGAHVIGIMNAETDAKQLWVYNLQLYQEDTLNFPTDAPGAITVDPSSVVSSTATSGSSTSSSSSQSTDEGFTTTSAASHSTTSPTTSHTTSSSNSGSASSSTASLSSTFSASDISTPQLIAIGCGILIVILLIVGSCLMLTRAKRSRPAAVKGDEKVVQVEEGSIRKPRRKTYRRVRDSDSEGSSSDG